PLTVQSKCPVVAVAFGTEAASVANVAPPSRDSSTRTKVSRPRLCVQVKDCVVPGAQVTAVFGAVTRMVAGTIEELDSAKPGLALGSWAATRSRAEAAGGPGADHTQAKTVAARPPQPGTGPKVVPPSVEKKTSNDASASVSAALHCSVNGTPAVRAVPTGASTVTEGGVVSCTVTTSSSRALPPHPSCPVRAY